MVPAINMLALAGDISPLPSLDVPCLSLAALPLHEGGGTPTGKVAPDHEPFAADCQP